MDDNATIKVSRVSTGMGITDEKQFTASSNYQETLRRAETESSRLDGTRTMCTRKYTLGARRVKGTPPKEEKHWYVVGRERGNGKGLGSWRRDGDRQPTPPPRKRSENPRMFRDCSYSSATIRDTRGSRHGCIHGALLILKVVKM